jgi:hypothetical protein
VRLRTGIQKDGVIEWDVSAKPEWYPGEFELVRRLPTKSRWVIAWAKRLRRPIDGRHFRVVGNARTGSYRFVRVVEEAHAEKEKPQPSATGASEGRSTKMTCKSGP